MALGYVGQNRKHRVKYMFKHKYFITNDAKFSLSIQILYYYMMRKKYIII